MPTIRIHAALFMAALIYAGTYSLAKDLMPQYMLPLGVVTLRVAGAAIFFALAKRLAAPHERIAGRADNLRAIACGLLGIALNQISFFAGLNLTTPITASLLQTISPIVVVLASAVLLGDKITPTRLLGIALGAAGAAALILGRPSSGKVAQDALLGSAFLLVNAAVFGLYLVLVAPLMRQHRKGVVLAHER
ncbi:MAG: EamA family transporter, partial [Hymenobacter sp.]